jgi:hypothetical protein
LNYDFNVSSTPLLYVECSQKTIVIYLISILYDLYSYLGLV